MTQRLIEEAQKMQEAWAYLRQNGAISLHDEKNRVCIHLWPQDFREHFPRYIVEERNSETFPYAMQVYGDDILFFALITEDEFAAEKEKSPLKAD